MDISEDLMTKPGFPATFTPAPGLALPHPGAQSCCILGNASAPAGVPSCLQPLTLSGTCHQGYTDEAQVNVTSPI